MKWILLDLNGVIITAKSSNFNNWLLKKGLKPQKVNKIYQKISWDLQKGKMSPKRAVKLINHELGTNIYSKEFFRAKISNTFSLNKPLINKVKKWKKEGMKVALFSDLSKPSWEFIKKKAFIKEFDDLIVSCNTHFRKEEPKYYDYLAKRLKCSKGDILIIDDSAEPIKTAKKSGIKTVYYTSKRSLAQL